MALRNLTYFCNYITEIANSSFTMKCWKTADDLHKTNAGVVGIVQSYLFAAASILPATAFDAGIQFSATVIKTTALTGSYALNNIYSKLPKDYNLNQISLHISRTVFHLATIGFFIIGWPYRFNAVTLLGLGIIAILSKKLTAFLYPQELTSNVSSLDNNSTVNKKSSTNPTDHSAGNSQKIDPASSEEPASNQESSFVEKNVNWGNGENENENTKRKKKKYSYKIAPELDEGNLKPTSGSSFVQEGSETNHNIANPSHTILGARQEGSDEESSDTNIFVLATKEKKNKNEKRKVRRKYDHRKAPTDSASQLGPGKENSNLMVNTSSSGAASSVKVQTKASTTTNRKKYQY